MTNDIKYHRRSIYHQNDSEYKEATKEVKYKTKYIGANRIIRAELHQQQEMAKSEVVMRRNVEHNHFLYIHEGPYKIETQDDVDRLVRFIQHSHMTLKKGIPT